MRTYLIFFRIFVVVTFFGGYANGDDVSPPPIFDVSDSTQKGPITLTNLNFNRQGNAIAVYPGEKVRALVNIRCDLQQIDPDTLYQVVIGYEDEEPQICILNEFGFGCEDYMIIPFFLKAPKSPGIYNVQFRLEQAPSPVMALQNWGNEQSLQTTIGKIVVLE